MDHTDQRFDYTKPFKVEVQYRDADGIVQYVVKETYPLKQSVEYKKRLGQQGPWDEEVR